MDGNWDEPIVGIVLERSCLVNGKAILVKEVGDFHQLGVVVKGELSETWIDRAGLELNLIAQVPAEGQAEVMQLKEMRGQIAKEHDRMKKPASVQALEDLGRVRLSKHFFMRDFLYSEISQIEGIPNITDYPDRAIEAGRGLCEQLLEPLQECFGRIVIRSAYRAPAVNAKGAENSNQYSCAANEKNYAEHIWDYPDAEGHLGATACIVVPALLPWYEERKEWTPLAWWIHDNLPYASQFWFPRLAAFNLRWSANPNMLPSISTYVTNPHTGGKKALVKDGVAIMGLEARKSVVGPWLASLRVDSLLKR